MCKIADFSKQNSASQKNIIVSGENKLFGVGTTYLIKLCQQYKISPTMIIINFYK